MVRRIQAQDGFYSSSADSSLSVEELQALAASIKGLTKVIQPNFVIDMQFDYELVQLQALQKITELLQPVIKSNIEQAKSKFTETNYAIINKDRNEVEIILPMQAFGYSKQHYPKLRAALIAISSIHVCYPKWSSKLTTPLYGSGPLCSYVAIHRDENDRRRELVHFFFTIEIATCLVSPQFGFTKLLQQTLQRSKNVYTTKIYMYICRAADKGKWAVSYSKLRDILCVGEKFLRYYDFRNRILKEAQQELHGNSNYWFDWVERYKNVDDAEPELLVFNIYSASSSLSNTELNDKHYDKIYETMTRTFGVKPGEAKKILRQITPRNMKYIWTKHNALLLYMSENSKNIDDLAAYYTSAIRQIIQTEKYSYTAQQQLLF